MSIQLPPVLEPLSEGTPQPGLPNLEEATTLTVAPAPRPLRWAAGKLGVLEPSARPLKAWQVQVPPPPAGPDAVTWTAPPRQ